MEENGTIKETLEEEKVSLKDFSIPHTNDENVSEIEWKDFKISVKKYLTFYEMLTLIASGIELVQSDGKYNPELKDAIWKYLVISYYTNVSFEREFYDIYDILYRTDLFYKVISAVDKVQYNVIKESFNEKIENIKATNIEQFNEKVRQVDEAVSKIEEDLKDVFSGITGDDVKNLLNSIGDGKLDEEKLMNAYFNNKTEQK